MNKLRIAFVACALIVSGACDKKEKENKGLPPADNWQAPTTDQAGGQAQAPANPHGMNMGGDPHAGMNMGGGDPHAGMNMGGNPHAGQGQGSVDPTALGLAPPDPERQIDPNKYLKGTIKPTAETKDIIPKGAVIFLSVKRADPSNKQGVGAPLAVKRLRLSTWPLWFQLTEEDAMVSGTAFEGEVVITAWADQDQDAMSKSPGDVLGTVQAKIPASDLVLQLDTVLK
jgi:hypothetical protein